MYTFEVKPIDVKGRLKERGISYRERDKDSYKIKLNDKHNEPMLEQILQDLNYR